MCVILTRESTQACISFTHFCLFRNLMENGLFTICKPFCKGKNYSLLSPRVCFRHFREVGGALGVLSPCAEPHPSLKDAVF